MGRDVAVRSHPLEHLRADGLVLVHPRANFALHLQDDLIDAVHVFSGRFEHVEVEPLRIDCSHITDVGQSSNQDDSKMAQ